MSYSRTVQPDGSIVLEGEEPGLSADGIVDLFTGTPDGTLFLRDDGTLALPAGGSFTASSTDTLTNKTLTAPKLADGGYIADANGNELIIGDTVTSAVNEITVANAATAGNPKISATGGDTNIGIDLQAKGTGPYNLLGTATSSAEARLYEDTDNGTNYVGLKAPASVASSLSFTLPGSTEAGKVLTDMAGDGVLSLETVDGGGYFDKATQTVAASTTADITWTDLLGPTAILTHSASSATIGVSATKNFDIDCSVLLGGANTAGLWGTAALVLLVDGTEVARDPQSFYDFNGSTTAKAGLVRTILWSGPVTTSIKLQLVTGATYGCDVVGTQSGSVRSCLRITQRGA